MTALARTSVPDLHTARFSIVQQDCLEFLRSLPEESVDLIVTDPAYSGMNQHMKFGHGRIVGHYGRHDNARWFREFHDDPDTYRAFLAECRRVLRNDRHIYIMFDSYSLLSLGAVVRESFDVKGLIVWDKVALGMGHYFRRRHEQIVFASKGRRRVTRRDLPDVWAVRRVHRAAYPAQKPVALFELMLEASAEPGDVVCDPFCGSGSSAVAALRRDCTFVGADIDGGAVDMARDRCAVVLHTGVDPLERGAVSARAQLASSDAGAGEGRRPAARPRA